jgi:hypothetical protein
LIFLIPTLEQFFCDQNDAIEYLYFKAGKVVAKKFDINFKEITQVIVENQLTKIIDLPSFVWETNLKYTKVV